ncbi:MAG: hypothetical protein IID06_08295, partial [Gemmatimonadetes bacterium]|nr:hypothetical protein [Gemmatimonadota bacterium]
MTSVPMGVIAIITALVAASWAALLALAEESPKVARALADTTTEREEPSTRYRIIHLSRLALLFIAGVSGAYAVEWWQRNPLPALGVIIVSVGFLYMIAEALPRAVGLLAPDVAAAAAPAAERTAFVFRPLLALVATVERAVRAILPDRRAGESGFRSTQRDLVMGVFSLGETTVGD